MTAASTACPAPDRLLAFASGELSDDQAATIESHIDACDGCRLALSSAARGDVPPKFGRYRIETVLGSGGMGIVYRAWDPQLARAVAIKVVKRGAEDASGRARLVREAQSMAKLSHPNVCHVYDVGTDGDEVWVAMELIDGVSLREWGGNGDVLAMLVGAAEGIAAAHAAGMVHRDVKPENVLVARDGRAIVTDFGLARGGEFIDPHASTIHTDPYHTATGAIAGTPAYLAPEQITGDPLDERVDQFAWAVMAWELIAGNRPFPIVFAARLEAIRMGVTPPATMDKRLAAVLARALALAPSARFPSMRALIDALRAPTRSRRAPLLAAAGVLAVAGGVAAFELRPRTPAPIAAAPAPIAKPLPVAIAPPPPVAVAPPAPAPPVAVTQPPPAPKLAPSPPKHAPVIARPVPAPSPPPAPVEHIVSSPEPASTLVSRAEPPLRRPNAYAKMLMFCQIPYDPAHPEGRGTFADWGKVTGVTTERGQFNGEAFDVPIIAVAGHRATYRVESEIIGMGEMRVAPGDTVALCSTYEHEPSDLYHYSGGPVIPVDSAFPVQGDPQIAEIAKHRALYTTSIRLAASSVGHRIDMATDRTYFLKAKSKGKRDGTIYEMDRWFLDVPPGMAGTDQIESGDDVWILIDRPTLTSGPDGSLRLVVHAIEVLPEVFP